MRYLKLAICIMTMIGLSGYCLAKGPSKGYMGGSGVMKDEPTDTGGMPGDVEGPLNDKISDKGQLYGDLYVILRYKGGETKKEWLFNPDGTPYTELVSWTDPDGNVFDTPQQQYIEVENAAIGGEPVLTEDFVAYMVFDEEYPDDPVPNPDAALQGVDTDWYCAPTPSQCVQPVASYMRWGDLSDPVNVIDGVRDYSGIVLNLIPLIKTYDPTWGRTEFSVGMEGRTNFIEAGETWKDLINGTVTYAEAVPWTGLIKEVSFGRLNQARAPEAVHQSAFDEAIASINEAAAAWQAKQDGLLPEFMDGGSIGVEASGRIFLTKLLFDEYLLDIDDIDGDGILSEPLLLGTYDKAIDSPLENLAMYMKVMRDGHIVTPGDQRAPIDRSGPGGIPISMLLELEDGPSTALRPTLTREACEMLSAAGLDHLLPAGMVTYWTWTSHDPVEDVVVLNVETEVGNLPAPEPEDLEEWYGIPTSDGSVPDGDDFEFCAAFLAAAADKTGKITVDHVVYLNSIMGLNKVVGESEDGVDYTKFPVFFNYGVVSGYDRNVVLSDRPWKLPSDGGGGDPAPGNGFVTVLQPLSDAGGDPIPGYEDVWDPTQIQVTGLEFRNLGTDDVNRFPDGTTETIDIGGFAQSTDDNLAIIEFVHTYQIPENR